MKTNIYIYIYIYILITISRLFLLRMRNVSDKGAEEIKTRILYSMDAFRKSWRL